jgi:hypothetical protein
MRDETVHILLFPAQGFEDLEATAVLDVFGWTQYREHIANASVTTAGFHEVVFLLMECLLGRETKEEVRNYMIYKNRRREPRPEGRGSMARRFCGGERGCPRGF